MCVQKKKLRRTDGQIDRNYAHASRGKNENKQLSIYSYLYFYRDIRFKAGDQT